MKYLKLFENHSDYFKQINSTEFDRYLRHNGLFCFTHNDKILISNFLGNYNVVVEYIPASIFSLEGTFWLYDDFDLDKYLDDQEVIIHTTSGSKHYMDVSIDDTYTLNDYSIKIGKDSESTSQIFINKSYDDWFLITYRGLYKCDQIDGLFKFLETKLIDLEK